MENQCNTIIMQNRKSHEVKRGQPGSIPLILLAALIAIRGGMDTKAYLVESSRSAGDLIFLCLTFVFFVVVAASLIKRLSSRWEIVSDGEVVSLKHNDNELFQGDVNELKLLSYDFGMLKFETRKGVIICFPAFGMMERFTYADDRKLV
jgi:hypothetical protein